MFSLSKNPWLPRISLTALPTQKLKNSKTQKSSHQIDIGTIIHWETNTLPKPRLKFALHRKTRNSGASAGCSPPTTRARRRPPAARQR